MGPCDGIFCASTNQSGPSIACSGHPSRASADALILDIASLIEVLCGLQEGKGGRVRTPRRKALARFAQTAGGRRKDFGF
jgi:hypothetical protein